jgi:hypothetical protein
LEGRAQTSPGPRIIYFGIMGNRIKQRKQKVYGLTEEILLDDIGA